MRRERAWWVVGHRARHAREQPLWLRSARSRDVATASAKIVIAATFFALAVTLYPRSWDGPQVFNSPRENVGYLLTERFAAGEGFRYPLRYYDELPPDVALALTPRDAAEINGFVVPQDFAGSLLIYGLLFAIWKPLVLGVTPLFAVLGALVLARIGEELFNRRVGLAAFALWLAYPPFVLNGAYVFSSDTISFFWALLAFLFFIRYWRSQQPSHLIWMTVALGFAALTRYPNILLALPAFMALVIGRRLSAKDSLSALASLAPFAAAYLIFNRTVYGDAALTGYQLKAELLNETANFAHVSSIRFRPAIVLDHLNVYTLELPLLLRPQLAGLFLGLLLAHRSRSLRPLILTFLAATALLAAYYSQQDGFGSFTPSVNASILRYLLPGLAIWTLLLVAGLFHLTQRTQIAAWAILAGILVLFVSTTFSGPQGIRDTRASVEQLRDLRSRVLETTEPEALIASRTMDKVLFPMRQTITLTHLMDNDVVIERGRRHPYDFVPDPARFAEAAVGIVERGIPLYVVADFGGEALQRYGESLQEGGLQLQLSSDGHLQLYRIVVMPDVQPPPPEI